MTQDEAIPLSKYMKALLALQLRSVGDGEADEKPELVLSSVGLSPKEIAEVLGKNVGAVTKTIQRAGKNAKGKG
jgi:DNA-directed RNA polymerase specialized sigma24 family protein